MPIFRANWTNGLVLRSSGPLGIGETSNHDINLSNLGADEVRAQISINIGSSTGVTVNTFHSSDGGSTFDTTPTLTYTTFSTGIRTITLRGSYVRIQLINDDSSNTSNNISIIYAWRNWVV